MNKMSMKKILENEFFASARDILLSFHATTTTDWEEFAKQIFVCAWSMSRVPKIKSIDDTRYGSQQGSIPDFSFTLKNQTAIHMEHTRATQEGYQVALKEMDKNPDAIMEPCMFGPEGLKPKQAHLGFVGHAKKALPNGKERRQKLIGRGWFGLQPELEWSTFVCDAIERKNQCVKPTYPDDGFHILLVHAQTPGMCLDLYSCLRILQSKNPILNPWFHQLWIIEDHMVIANALDPMNAQMIDVSKNTLLNFKVEE